ncbi:MAG: tailspike [Podoviridae sp. ctpVR23]|nr:MAG: tailspike [Podoviridae sp. ctpVR23]
MTISTQSTQIEYSADGVQTVFSFDFKIMQAADLKVYVGGIAQTTGFSVSGVGDEDGGTVTFSVAPLNGKTIKFKRLTAKVQDLVLREFQKFPAQSVEANLDKIVSMVQELATEDGELREYIDDAYDYIESLVFVGGVQTSTVVLSMKQLSTDVSGTQSVRGFYAGSSIGGGDFYYDATMNKSNHDGFSVISPESLDAWDGTLTNAHTIFMWAGTGTGCFVRKNYSEILTSQFGFKPNEDCTNVAVRVGAVALSLGLTIVNDVQSIISGPVIFRNEVRCDKKFIVSGMGYIMLQHTYSGVPVVVDIANMIRGAALSGVSGYLNGTLVIVSTEKLIDRIGNEPSEDPTYCKEETAELVSESGVIQPYWMHTYTDAAAITATVYPAEDYTKNRIWIEYINPDLNNFAVLRVSKSNCDLELDIKVNGTKSSANVALYLYDCCNIKCYPRISGFQSTLGYGIHARRVSSVSFIDGDVTECRRPIANRMDKRTRVIRGFYRSSGSVSCVDTHWTDDIVLDGVLGYCKGLAILDFAGYNATVRNCTLIDALGVIGNRPDTPVCGGSVIIENNEIKQTRELFAYFFSKSVGEDYAGCYDWELPWPDLIRIKGNIVNISDSNWSTLRLNASRFPRTQIKLLDVSNNTYLSDLRPTGIVQMGCRALDTHPDYRAIDPKIVIDGEVFQAGSTYGIIDIQRQGASWKWDITLTNTIDLYFRLDEDVAKRVRLNGGNFIGSRVSTFRLNTDPVKTPSFMYEMRGVRFPSSCLLYGSSNLIMAFGCIFESGGITYSNDTSDQQPLSTDRQTAFAVAMGNVAELPVTSLGSLPPLDGWYSEPSAYSRMAIAKHNNGAIGTSDLGPYGIGYRDDIESLVIINAAGAVRKIATTA